MTLPLFPTATPHEGVERQVLAESPDMMVVSFRFATGARGALHQHPHAQSTYIRTGRFQFFRGGEAFELQPGDSLVIPPQTEHGCICQEAGELIDVFTPRRDDFL